MRCKCVSEPRFSALLRFGVRPAVAIAALVLKVTFAAATTITTDGYAVGVVGSTAKVGVYQNSTIGNDAIKFYIPLSTTSGTYAVGTTCGGTGFGTCTDSGHGGGTLTMNLLFPSVSVTYASTLTLVFDDLDLNGVNDPAYLLENLNIFENGVSLTNWISNISNPLIAGDANKQTLSLSLGVLPSESLYLSLKFKASSAIAALNTPEFLLATVSAEDGDNGGGVDPVPLMPMPLPATVALLLGWFGWLKLRQRRHRYAQA